MRDSYVNYFWTGKAPTKKLMDHLVATQEHIVSCGSEFRVRLWVTQDLYDSKLGNNPNVLEKNGKLYFQHGDHLLLIESVEPLLEDAKTQYPGGLRLYDFLYQKGLYSFCSSFIRMLILNKEPGFYCDTDICLHGTHFPRTIDDFEYNRELSAKQLVFGYYNGRCGENQVMLTLKKDAFDTTIKSYDEHMSVSAGNLDKDFDSYDKRIQLLKEIIKNDPTLHLEANQPHLKKYTAGGRIGYEVTDKKLFGSDENELEKVKQTLESFETFFTISMQSAHYFTESKSAESDQYKPICQLIQDTFYNPTQDKRAVYTWSNPIYFHIEKIGQKAHPIQTFFREKLTQKMIKIDNIDQCCKKVDTLGKKLILKLLAEYKYFTPSEFAKIISSLSRNTVSESDKKEILLALRDRSDFQLIFSNEKDLHHFIKNLALSQNRELPLEIKTNIFDKIKSLSMLQVFLPHCNFKERIILLDRFEADTLTYNDRNTLKILRCIFDPSHSEKTTKNFSTLITFYNDVVLQQLQQVKGERINETKLFWTSIFQTAIENYINRIASREDATPQLGQKFIEELRELVAKEVMAIEFKNGMLEINKDYSILFEKLAFVEKISTLPIKDCIKNGFDAITYVDIVYEDDALLQNFADNVFLLELTPEDRSQLIHYLIENYKMHPKLETLFMNALKENIDNLRVDLKMFLTTPFFEKWIESPFFNEENLRKALKNIGYENFLYDKSLYETIMRHDAARDCFNAFFRIEIIYHQLESHIANPEKQRSFEINDLDEETIDKLYNHAEDKIESYEFQIARDYRDPSKEEYHLLTQVKNYLAGLKKTSSADDVNKGPGVF